MRSAPAAEVTAGIRQEFGRLVREWKESRGPRTTLKAMVEHPAHRAIIGLGEPAIPLLLEELVRDPDWWFSALRALTGANPVRAEDQGNLGKMAAAWIQWGRSHEYTFAKEPRGIVPEAGNGPTSHHQPL